jgi:homoserine kinase
LNRLSATAFAPASIGNVAVGFDVLGLSFPAIGDRVRAKRTPGPYVTIASISGVTVNLPLDPEKNTAGRAVLGLLQTMQPGFGVELKIEKGIPLGSGLGGSAASAVAAVVATNALLPQPLTPEQLLPFAMQGEAVASGAVHVDNIAPSLIGGLVLTVGVDRPSVRQIPVPAAIRCVLVHPHMELPTREARQILSRSVHLSNVIWQTANLAGFITACFTGDLALIRESLQDVMIEPQRQRLIPGFPVVKRGALDSGALGCSISGAGPTVFAWCESHNAERVRSAMVAGFADHGLECDSWICALDAAGARVVD